MKKNVLITGASSGIGYEFVKIYAKKGDNLIIVSKDKTRLETIRKQIEKEFNVNATAISKDLSTESSADEIYNEVKKENIEVDVLINNAGFGLLGSYDKVSYDRQRDLLGVNVISVMRLCYLFIPDMKKKEGCQILNTCSIAGFESGPFMSMYYASKAFVLSFSEALNKELKNYNIKVTALCPGPVATNFERRAGLKDKSMMFKTLYVMSPSKVAYKGYKALNKGKCICIPGFTNKLIVFSNRLLPRSLMKTLTCFINKGKFK